MDLEFGSNKLKKKPTKVEDMTKEQLRHAIIKKKECNAKAQQIVESLLEKGVTEAYFLRCLPDINQAHFDDIVEERSIIHLCGYPICEKTISVKDIPKQKYRISVKTNKIYDITARKSFCSNSCYNAAMYVKKQMLTSPLWFREYEIIPTFTLLPLQSPGRLGQEIDISQIEKVKIKTEKNLFTSINDFAKASVNEIQDSKDCSFTSLNENDSQESTAQKELEDKSLPESISKGNESKVREIDNITCMERTQNETEICKTSLKLKESSEDAVKILDKTETAVNEKPEALRDEIRKTTEQLKKLTVKEKNKPVLNLTNIVRDVVEKAQRKIDPILLDKPQDNLKKPKIVQQKKQPVVTALTIEVEKCLAEWFTLDTMLFLFGEEKAREMVADKGECIKEYLNNYAKGIFYNTNSYDQYQQLCKKLNMLEIEDRHHDTQTLQRETRPLPDYSILQEESKRMQLKVKAFISGQTEMVEDESQPDKSVTEEDNVTQLPLVDKNAQNALRRRIVCQHLNKVLPDLLRSLGLLTLTISSDVQLLVDTFKLRADNIMFKPIQWTLIATVFIKLLSIREKRLEYLLEQPMAFQHMQLLLLSYKQDGGYLDRLISWLCDIDRLLDTNDTQLTIE